MGAAIISIAFLLFINRIMVDMAVSTALITYSVYSLNRITDMEEDASNIPERVKFLEDKKELILILSIMSYTAALLIGILKNIWTLPIFLTPFLVGVVYSIKIASFRIKDVFGMKNISIAFSWAFSSSFLPYVFVSNMEKAIFIFLFLFIKCFVNTVVFDMRDVEGDRKAGAKTIPVVLGIETTKNILILTNSMIIAWAIICYMENLFIEYLPVVLFSAAYGYWYINAFSREKKESAFNYDYLVDGEFIILAFTAIAINFIF